MQELTQKTNELNALYQEKIAALEAQKAEGKAALDHCHKRELACSEVEDTLAERENKVVGIEYQQEVVDRSEGLIKATSAARDELNETIQSLAKQKDDFAKDSRAKMDSIEQERLLQRKNSLAIIQREKGLDAREAELKAKFAAIGA